MVKGRDRDLKKRAKTKTGGLGRFNPQFEFSVGTNDFATQTWTISREIRRAAKGQVRPASFNECEGQC